MQEAHMRSARRTESLALEKKSETTQEEKEMGQNELTAIIERIKELEVEQDAVNAEMDALK